MNLAISDLHCESSLAHGERHATFAPSSPLRASSIACMHGPLILSVATLWYRAMGMTARVH